MNCLSKHNKISVTTAEFNGLSSEIYGNWIPHSELRKDIAKNITWCNLHSHGGFLKAQSHISLSHRLPNIKDTLGVVSVGLTPTTTVPDCRSNFS